MENAVDQECRNSSLGKVREPDAWWSWLLRLCRLGIDLYLPA